MKLAHYDKPLRRGRLLNLSATKSATKIFFVPIVYILLFNTPGFNKIGRLPKAKCTKSINKNLAIIFDFSCPGEGGVASAGRTHMHVRRGTGGTAKPIARAYRQAGRRRSSPAKDSGIYFPVGFVSIRNIVFKQRIVL